MSEPIGVAVSIDLVELRAVQKAASADYRRIQTFAYAIADIVGAERGAGPAEEERAQSALVMTFLDDLTRQAERLHAAQREPFTI